MQFYKDLERRKELVRDFIRKNPYATFLDIKKKIHTKVNKVYLGGMEEAFEAAGVAKPRTLKFKNKEERRRIVIDFIRKNPLVGGQKIKKETKINIQTIFKDTKEAFEAAGIKYPRSEFIKLKNRSYKERKKRVISLLKKNPLLNMEEISKLSKISMYHHFHDIKQLYKEAGLKYPGKGATRKIKKQNKIIDFIKLNKFSTQRENKSCVQN